MYLALRPQQGPARVLLAAFALQVYVLASLWGKGEFLPHTGNHAGAFLPRAYGMRHLTESLVPLAPGLAFLLERASGWRFRLLAGLGFTLVFGNLVLILQYSYGLLPQDAGLAPRELATLTGRFLQNESLTCLLLAEVLGLLWLLLVWGREAPPLRSFAPAPAGPVLGPTGSWPPSPTPADGSASSTLSPPFPRTEPDTRHTGHNGNTARPTD